MSRRGTKPGKTDFHNSSFNKKSDSEVRAKALVPSGVALSKAFEILLV
jgi:hypothetical protein